LAQSSLASLALLAGPTATAVALPRAGTNAAKRSVGSFAPPLFDPELLRTLARTTISAAVDAGADYADVRVNDQRFAGFESVITGRLFYNAGFGVRVRVGAGHAFVGGIDMTPDAVTRAARSATTTAKGLAKMAGTSPSWVTGPAATGEWTTPMEIDPFEMSVEDQVFATCGYGHMNRFNVLVTAFFQWLVETRVVASSAGTLVTQQLARSVPLLFLKGRSKQWYDPELYLSTFGVAPFVPSTAGFEAVLGAARHDQVDRALEEFSSLFGYPVGDAEPGRKDVIFDGGAMANLAGATLLPALSLSSVLGEEQNAGGISFLQPPEQVLGHLLFSPQLTFGVETGGTHFGTAHWDDEGVPLTSYPLIERGTVVNYISTASNVGALASWYGQQKRPVLSPGGSWTEHANNPPQGAPGALVMTASPSGPSIEEMIKSVKDGYYVYGANIRGDFQSAGGVIFPDILFEIKNGRITRRILNTRLEFGTKKFFKQLTAIGGPTTMRTIKNDSYSGVPWGMVTQSVAAPAVHVQGVDILANRG